MHVELPHGRREAETGPGGRRVAGRGGGEIGPGHGGGVVDMQVTEQAC